MDRIVTKKVIFSKDGIEITRNTHASGELTFTAINTNKGALRTYIQAPSLDAISQYMLVS